jgi:branched-chain amino acid transport system ATP-binding protein
MSMLSISDLKVSYGGIEALKGVDLHVNEGELVTLIGANGAGKTTLLKTLVGLVKPKSGKLEFNGRALTDFEVHQHVERGLVLVPEGRGIFGRLTVEENLHMGAYTGRNKAVILRDIEHAYTLFPRLKERRHQLAGTLSGGEQQMLAIGRALMGHPKLLLLDEPSMGLAPIIVQQIFAILRQIASEGVTMLLIEQNARLALQTAQRGYVMESGRITMVDQAEVLLANPKIQSAYLGE